MVYMDNYFHEAAIYHVIKTTKCAVHWLAGKSSLNIGKTMTPFKAIKHPDFATHILDNPLVIFSPRHLYLSCMWLGVAPTTDTKKLCD